MLTIVFNLNESMMNLPRCFLIASFIIIVTLITLTHRVVNGFCFGVVCNVAPMMSKYCCKLKRYCCQEYQSWLAPIIGTNDFLQEYVEAVAHEVINDQRDPFWRIFSRKVDGQEKEAVT